MKNTFQITAGLLLALSSVTQASPTVIQSCGFVISQPGDYELGRNLVCPNQNLNAIRIANTKNVDLKLKGYRITFIGHPAPLPFPGLRRATGIRVDGSHDIDIRGDSGSSITRARTAVLVSNSEDVKVKETTLSTNSVGISFQGSGSEDGKVKEVNFSGNTCDIQVGSGAENPDLDDNSPQNPTRCS